MILMAPLCVAQDVSPSKSLHHTLDSCAQKTVAMAAHHAEVDPDMPSTLYDPSLLTQPIRLALPPDSALSGNLNP